MVNGLTTICIGGNVSLQNIKDKKMKKFGKVISRKMKEQRKLLGESISPALKSQFTAADRQWLEAFDLAEMGGATAELSQITKVSKEVKREFFKEVKRRENDAMTELRNFDTDELALVQTGGCSSSAFIRDEDSFGMTKAVSLADKREEHLLSRKPRGGWMKKYLELEAAWFGPDISDEQYEASCKIPSDWKWGVDAWYQMSEISEGKVS